MKDKKKHGKETINRRDSFIFHGGRQRQKYNMFIFNKNILLNKEISDITELVCKLSGNY